MLFAYVHGLLLLDVTPGQAFATKGHYPIFAGVSETANGLANEYLAVVGPSVDRRSGAGTHPLWCTVREGDTHATYWVERGQSRRGKGNRSEANHATSSSHLRLVRRTTPHFQVLALRFEPMEYGPAATGAMKAMNGRDATGPYFWGTVYSRPPRIK